MAVYSGNQSSDPITINGLFLKIYLDLIRDIGPSLDTNNQEAFLLHVMRLRACVIGKSRRDAIDASMVEMQKKIDNDVFGEFGKRNAEWLRGFCVIESCADFLNTTFKLIQTDGTALLDSTDDELMQDIQKWRLITRIQNAYGMDHARVKELTARVMAGNISQADELEAVISEQSGEPEEVLEPGTE